MLAGGFRGVCLGTCESLGQATFKNLPVFKNGVALLDTMADEKTPYAGVNPTVVENDVGVRNLVSAGLQTQVRLFAAVGAEKTRDRLIQDWFLPSFLHTVLPSFLPSLLPSYSPSFLPSYSPSFLLSYSPLFLPPFMQGDARGGRRAHLVDRLPQLARITDRRRRERKLCYRLCLLYVTYR